MRYLKGSYLNTSTTPALTGAAGRWKLADQFDAARQGTWPSLGVTASGGTATSGNSYNQWSFTTTGSNTFTVTSGGTVYYAIVAGGGGGGYWNGGGGGGGGVVIGQTTLTAGTYTIVVGAGGAGGTNSTYRGTNGNNSSAFGFTAVGGGGGGGYTGSTYVYSTSGGSSGGCQASGDYILLPQPAVAGQGWSGGSNGTTASTYPSAGGGGAGGIGGTGSGSQSGAGGLGISVFLPVAGSSTTYAGGGGGGAYNNGGVTAGAGGSGGGGAGGQTTTGTSGTANTGGGGGGGAYNSAGFGGGAGGSGIVVIWSLASNPAKTPYVQYLAVAGGGGGTGGGGGAGGVLQGIAQITASATYTITVGSGGAGAGGSGTGASNGVNSTILGTGVSVTAIGGGGAGANGNVPSSGSTGGSGGGAGTNNIITSSVAGGAGTTGQGYSGGASPGIRNSPSGGGGGYGMVGYAGTSALGGSGGDGFTSYIANPSTYSWSNHFNGSGDYLSAGTSVTNFLCTGTSTGATATFEAWVYPTTYYTGPNAWNFSSIYAKDGTYINFGTYNGYLRFYWYDGSFKYVQSANTTDVPLYTWTHVAVTINGSTIKLYVNGSLNTTSATYTGVQTAGSGTADQIGREAAQPSYFTGYISNLRITNTVVYSSAFTPSTTPLTAVSGTQLLTCQAGSFSDASSNNFTITAVGNAYIASQNPFGVSYAGGGAGAYYANTGGYGGMGGGANGAGGTGATVGLNGSVNTGGGGGGGNGAVNGSYLGGTGGSGIVILAYPSTYATAASTTGSPTLTTANGYNVYTFTASGSITI